MKAQSAQLIAIRFPLAVVAGFLHTCKVQGKYSTNFKAFTKYTPHSIQIYFAQKPDNSP